MAWRLEVVKKTSHIFGVKVGVKVLFIILFIGVQEPHVLSPIATCPLSILKAIDCSSERSTPNAADSGVRGVSVLDVATSRHPLAGDSSVDSCHISPRFSTL